MRRTHCATKADPIVVKAVDPSWGPDGNTQSLYKPRGFWYEVDGDWRRWMQDEDWGLGGALHLHEVNLGQTRTLLIRSVERLDAFHEAYAIDPYPELGFTSPRPGKAGWIPDWKRLGAEYDGLEIAPYLWSRRLDGPFWYYGWDCASGVIWRPRGVAVNYLGPLNLKATSHSDR